MRHKKQSGLASMTSVIRDFSDTNQLGPIRFGYENARETSPLTPSGSIA
jgi:hypothetical protein